MSALTERVQVPGVEIYEEVVRVAPADVLIALTAEQRDALVLRMAIAECSELECECGGESMHEHQAAMRRILDTVIVDLQGAPTDTAGFPPSTPTEA
jgi:hypothetical protein